MPIDLHNPTRTRRSRQQFERTRITRTQILLRATEHFARHGYYGAKLEAIARDSRVTRGAVHHHFRNKRGLFEATAERAADSLNQSIEQAVFAGPTTFEAFFSACHAFVQLNSRQPFRRLLLLDAPAVFGWERWRVIDNTFGVVPIERGLGKLMENQAIPVRPVEPLARLIHGAAAELARWTGSQPAMEDKGRRALRGLLEAVLL